MGKTFIGLRPPDSEDPFQRGGALEQWFFATVAQMSPGSSVEVHVFEAGGSLWLEEGEYHPSPVRIAAAAQERADLILRALNFLTSIYVRNRILNVEPMTPEQRSRKAKSLWPTFREHSEFQARLRDRITKIELVEL